MMPRRPARFGTHAPTALLALLAATCALNAPTTSAQMHNCELGKLSDHLKSVERHCCKDNDCSKTGFPTKDGKCTVECGKVLEPFWDGCGEILQVLKMMPDGMDKFYKKCLVVLYPPGRCPKGCKSKASFHCKSMEVNNACCDVAGNCKKGRSTPNKCSVGCSLVYP